MKTIPSIKVSLLATIALSLVVASMNVPASAGRFAQNHPRRAEVNHRDNRIKGRLNRNLGDLGGHYGQLKSEARGIRQQQRADAKANGGYITRSQKQQLNKEENSLNQQIRQDKTK